LNAGDNWRAFRR